MLFAAYTLYLNSKAIFPPKCFGVAVEHTRILATSSNLLSSPSDIGLSPLSAKLDVLTRQGEKREGKRLFVDTLPLNMNSLSHSPWGQSTHDIHVRSSFFTPSLLHNLI